jgi:hypothetical protein
MNDQSAGGIDPARPSAAAAMSSAKKNWAVSGPADRLGLIAGGVALVSSFLPWYRVSYHAPNLPISNAASASAWRVSFGGWFPVLLLIALAVLIGVRNAGVKLPAQATTALQLGQLVGPPLAAVIIVIRWLSYPGGSSTYVSAGAGFGLFVGLAAALVGCAGALLVFRGANSKTR